jgi:hypothetical protein
MLTFELFHVAHINRCNKMLKHQSLNLMKNKTVYSMSSTTKQIRKNSKVSSLFSSLAYNSCTGVTL